MKKIPFSDIYKGCKVIIRSRNKLYEADVVSTTEGHLGLQEIRITTGEVFSYQFTDIFPFDPETKTECLLSGEEIFKRKKKKEKT